MDYTMILIAILAVLLFGSTIAFYGWAYANANPGIIPQFQGIVGSIFLGSIVMCILGYLVLIEWQPSYQRLAVLFLAFIAIFVSAMAFAWSS